MSTRAGGSFSSSIGLNVLDRSIPGIIATETRSKSLSALMITIASLLASLLTTASASLFARESKLASSTGYYLFSTDIFQSSSAEAVVDWQSPNLLSEKSVVSSSLILLREIEYPESTFEDLVFPRLSVTSNKSWQQTGTERNFLSHTLRPSGWDLDRWRGFCLSDLVYVWGYITFSGSSVDYSSTSIHSYACNETLQELTTLTRFFGPEVRIDRQFPPVVTNIVRNSEIIPGVLRGYQLDVSSPEDRIHLASNQFFDLLMKSPRFLISNTTTLRDPNKVHVIADAIRAQYGIMQAQWIHHELRGEIEPDVRPEFYEATVDYYPDGSLCLTQDHASTRILQALFACIILLTTVAWLYEAVVTDKEVRKLPFVGRSQMSIAGTMALLADSNLFDFLPSPETEALNIESGFHEGSTEGFTKKKLERAFKGYRFKLGWTVPRHGLHRTQTPVEKGEDKSKTFNETLQGGEENDKRDEAQVFTLLVIPPTPRETDLHIDLESSRSANTKLYDGKDTRGLQ
ncbi:hypothetical protein QBC35DRAFT_541567 [Podospora australis]|uniref:Uncharacterized protein n=1 Tax=Podospora australis TaxID=1536484 RepID=A0AAN7AFI1_9PEZI|nr:hypothetical protein QBC35DRAFT_541567 [Podospora australis]